MIGGVVAVIARYPSKSSRLKRVDISRYLAMYLLFLACSTKHSSYASSQGDATKRDQ